MTNELDMDVRLLRRNLSKGFISEASVDELLDALPDVAERGEWVDPRADGEIAGDGAAAAAAEG